MFSTQPGESPGVVPNALVYSCSLIISKVRRRNLNRVQGNKMLFSHSKYLKLCNFVETELDFLFYFQYKGWFTRYDFVLRQAYDTNCFV